MAFFNFFHRPKPKKFGFIPRYYDPEKEERDARLARYNNEKDEIGGMKSRIQSGLRTRRGLESADIKKKARRSNLILIMSLTMLVLLAYYVLVKYLPILVEMIEK
jgi:hypothetical protein